MNNGYQETLLIISSLWKHKLFTIAGINLSLGNVTVALVMLLFAARLSRLISKLINKRLILRFVHDKGSQVTYQTFSYYISLALTVCMALTIAGIPLTVFTVVGGALAIGVGFGSQNIVNNFISGVILLIEQPIRVGDSVQLDGGISGVVVSINTRSTKIRNAENKIFIIPNSFFLEKSVLNSTYATPVLRGVIDFGVAYGSDTRLVENLCMDIMLNTQGVVQNPMPNVQFTNFADSNLTFKMTFYSNVNNASIDSVSSEIRFKLNDKFREMEVEMAFPQREMLLKVKDSLNVKILS